MAAPKRQFQQVSYSKWTDPAGSTLKAAGRGQVAAATDSFAFNFAVPSAVAAKPYPYSRKIVPLSPKKPEAEVEDSTESTAVEQVAAEVVEKEEKGADQKSVSETPGDDTVSKGKADDEGEKATEEKDGGDAPSLSEESSLTEANKDAQPPSEEHKIVDNPESDPSASDKPEGELDMPEAPQELPKEAQKECTEAGEVVETTIADLDAAPDPSNEPKQSSESSKTETEPEPSTDQEEKSPTDAQAQGEVASVPSTEIAPAAAENASTEASDSPPRSPMKISFAPEVADGKPRKLKIGLKHSSGSKPSKPKAKREARLRELKLAESNAQQAENSDARSESDSASEESALELSKLPAPAIADDESKSAAIITPKEGKGESSSEPVDVDESAVSEEVAASEGDVASGGNSGKMEAAAADAEEQKPIGSAAEDSEQSKKSDKVSDAGAVFELQTEEATSRTHLVDLPDTKDEQVMAESEDLGDSKKLPTDKKTKNSTKKKTKTKNKAASDLPAPETVSKPQSEDDAKITEGEQLALKSESPEATKEPEVDNAGDEALPAAATIEGAKAPDEDTAPKELGETIGALEANEDSSMADTKIEETPVSEEKDNSTLESPETSTDSGADPLPKSDEVVDPEGAKTEGAAPKGTEPEGAESETVEPATTTVLDDAVPLADNSPADVANTKGAEASANNVLDVAVSQTDAPEGNASAEEPTVQKVSEVEESLTEKVATEQENKEELPQEATDIVRETEIPASSTDATAVETPLVEADDDRPPPSPTLSKRSTRRSNEHPNADHWTRPAVRVPKSKDRAKHPESPPKSPQKSMSGGRRFIRPHRSNTEDDEDGKIAWAKQVRQNATLAAEEEERKARRESKRAAQVKMELRKAEEAEEKRLVQAKRRKERREEIDRLIEERTGHDIRERDLPRRAGATEAPLLAMATDGVIRRHRRRRNSGEGIGVDSNQTTVKRSTADNSESNHRHRRHRHHHHKREVSEQALGGAGQRTLSPEEEARPKSGHKAESERHADRSKRRRRSDADERRGRQRRNSAEAPTKSLWQGLRKALAVAVT